MENKKNYKCMNDKKDGSIIISFIAGEFKGKIVKVKDWDIDQEGNLSYNLLFSSTDDESKLKENESFTSEVVDAIVSLITTAMNTLADAQKLQSEREEQILKADEKFRKVLISNGLEVPNDKLSLEYAAEHDALIGINPDTNEVFAMNIHDGKPIDLMALVNSILLDHPANKLIV